MGRPLRTVTDAPPTARRRRDGRRVVLACRTPGLDFPDVRDHLPSFGVRRIHAAVVADPEMPDAEVTVVDSVRDDVDEYLRRILECDPDVVGFSTYVWSLPSFYEVARRLREEIPDCTIVFGGPSARPEMFELEPYKGAVEFADVLAIWHAEFSFRDVVRARDRSHEELAKIPGLAVPQAGRWVRTAEREEPLLLDVASPFQLDLMPNHAWAYLETYRGCPMSCSFCQWGSAAPPRDVLPTERIVAEFEAFKRHKAYGVVHLDAGLTLNKRAFQNLAAAEREVGFLKDSRLVCEVYPSHLTNDHVNFLRNVGVSYVGVGLQSYNQTVLNNVERPAKAESFDEIVKRLVRDVGNVSIEIIMGLPGDSLESFKRTVNHALELGGDVHVFHCLVLPDAMMVRAPSSFELKYDTKTLMMESCIGWTPDDLHEAREFVTGLARSMNGVVGPQEWITGRFSRENVKPRGDLEEADKRWPAPVTVAREPA